MLKKASLIKDKVVLCLAGVLKGDRLAAEYVYLSLFSKMFVFVIDQRSKRIAGVPIGTMPLNIIGDFNKEEVNAIREVIQRLIPMMASISLSIDSLNNSLWMNPSQTRGDGEIGLCRGELQCPDQTFFLIDECEMSEGNLLERGARNLKGVQTAVELGIVEIDLNFCQSEMNCEFGFLFIGKSPSLVSGMICLKIKEGLINHTELDPNFAVEALHLIHEMKRNSFQIPPEMEQV